LIEKVKSHLATRDRDSYLVEAVEIVGPGLVDKDGYQQRRNPCVSDNLPSLRDHLLGRFAA
jgi:hypothetical protein